MITLLILASLTSTAFGKWEYLTVGSTDPDDVQFFLYPNQDDPSDNDEIVHNNVSSLQNSRMDPSKPIIILNHGFMGDYLSEVFPQHVKNAYLQAGFTADWNIIITNWGLLSSPKNENLTIPIVADIVKLPVYVQAVGNVYVVGKRIQQFLSFLQQNGYLENGGDSVHLVGHSLGAHVSGMAGFYWKKETGTLLKRISGNDPAKPGFQFQIPNLRLDASDAKFVDAYHTNQGVAGYIGDLGHADFYPNGGGPFQPECQTDIGCPHQLAPKYFAKSILDNTIKACPKQVPGPFLPPTPCAESQKVTYGQYCPLTARGEYELTLRL